MINYIKKLKFKQVNGGKDGAENGERWGKN
jgi:hypothetical protein